jgi:cell wall-associated NlpC family hydrolase
LVVSGRWTTLGIAAALLSVGSTISTTPGQAAPDGRVLYVLDAPSGTTAPTQLIASPVQPSAAPAQVVAPPAGESIGATFAYLAARAGGAPPAQVVPNADPNNPYGSDGRSSLPSFNAPPSAAPPSFSGQGAGAGAAQPAQPPAPPPQQAVQPPVQPGINPAASGVPPLTGSVTSIAPPLNSSSAATPPNSTSSAPPNTITQQGAIATYAGAQRNQAVIAAPPSNTGAPGTAAGPAPRVAGPNGTQGTGTSATSNGTSSSGSVAGRIIPNLPATERGQRVVNTALTQIGNRYTWAGVSPSTGFDCSGFVYWVFNQIGFPLDRTMPEQLAAGRRVRLEELRPGDVLFFSDTYTPGLSHNAIWVGDGSFVHAADESTGIVTTRLSTAYWEQKLTAAVRYVE